MSEIVDSQLSVSEALAQNPESVCPDEIYNTLGVMEVDYIGFDNKRHVGQIAVAQVLISEVEAFFRHANEERFPIARVIPAAHPKYAWSDEKIMADNASSGFNYRLIAGTGKPSKHDRGWAFDINPAQNPYIQYSDGKEIVQPKGAVWDPNVPGTLHANHPLVKLMEGMNWEWGGHWAPDTGRTDYQHIQRNI